MKTISLFLLLTMGTMISAEAHRHNRSYTTISIQTFYDELSPYGDWVYAPDYGYVWRPYFDYPESFRPYSSNGNWVNTELGWTWVSNYNWGWATFHYGRWAFDDYLGWMWVPGYEWAPAWVSWGSYDNCWGWAPMGPDNYPNYNTGWSAPVSWWTFVPRTQFCSQYWNEYIYDRPVYVTNITYITNVYVSNNNYYTNNTWNCGPRVADVERYSRNRVRRVEISESERPGNYGLRDNRLEVYRPRVDNKRNDTRPDQYRNIESARSERRIEPSNPRVNNPGNNRSREIRNENRNTTQPTGTRNESIGRENRDVRQTPAQTQDNRTNNATGVGRNAPRGTSQSQPSTGTVNRETRGETNYPARVNERQNTQRPVNENKREIPAQTNTTGSTERNRPVSVPARNESQNQIQTRNVAPQQTGTNQNAVRENGNRQTNRTVVSSEQRNQSTAPAATTRTQNVERKQAVSQDTKQTETGRVNESNNRSTNNKTNRR